MLAPKAALPPSATCSTICPPASANTPHPAPYGGWTSATLTHPTFRGIAYARLFSEDRTGYAVVRFTPDKTTRSLIDDLTYLSDWVLRNVPGAAFLILRCDFGSEVARQGHGDDTLVTALRAYCRDHPGTRVVPVAPHSQAHNKAENTWGAVHGRSYTIACRARLGPPAWSITIRCGVFQHNHNAASRGNDKAAQSQTRSFGLTGRTLDASTMLGYPGQGCWAHNSDAKANAFRAAASACLYLHPCTETSAQLVYNISSMKLEVVRSVAMHDLASAIPALLASSSLYAPHGLLTAPDPDTHTAALRALLTYTGSMDASIVTYDPLSGMPSGLCPLVPAIAADGSLHMIPEIPQPPRHRSPIPSEPWIIPPTAPGVPTAYPAPPQTPPAPPACHGAADALAPPSDQPIPSAFHGMSDAQARALAIQLLLPSNATSSIHVDPAAKRSGASRPRYDACVGARTVAEYAALHTAYTTAIHSGIATRADLAEGLRRGDICVRYMVARGVVGAHDVPTARLADRVQRALDQHEGIHRLSRLEPTPLPGTHVPSADPPPLAGDPRTHTECYARGAARVHSALIHDMAATRALAPTHEDDWAIPPPHPQWEVPPSIAMYAAPVASEPVAPKSATAASRLPDYDAPHGWKAAIPKELDRVEGFGGWSVVSADVVRKHQRDYPGRVSIGHVVGVLRLKLDPDGDPRDPDIVKKFRVALSDPQSKAMVIQTYSSTADPMSNMTITAISTAIRAHQTSIDVGGAYWWGTVLSMAHGGRAIFCVVPSWLVGFVGGKTGITYQSHTSHKGRPRRLFLQITGNMPGRCDAGRIWQATFDEFLLGYGLHQLVTDRRVWVICKPMGDLIIHDHVDDSRLTSTTTAARSHFYTAWALRFGEPPESAELSEDFVGLRHRPRDDGAIEISCDGVIKKLGALIADRPLPRGACCTSPLPDNAMLIMRNSGLDGDTLCPDELPFAQQVGGTIGFVTTAVRLDSNFAYCAISRYINLERLTRRILHLLLRIAHYLVSTMHLHLYLAAPSLTVRPDGTTGLDLFEAYADSSHGSDRGLSHGGFVLMTRQEPGGPRSGALAWKCQLPPEGSDSPGAAELKVVTTALKYTIAVRTLQDELDCGVGPTRPTPIFTDSKTVIDGTDCARLIRSSRWLAAKYAMCRWGLACGTISLDKIDGISNVGDLMTKPLTGQYFFDMRARALGLPIK